jgi:hypothetical protein
MILFLFRHDQADLNLIAIFAFDRGQDLFHLHARNAHTPAEIIERRLAGGRIGTLSLSRQWRPDRQESQY